MSARHPRRGYLVAIEGIDGAGKSTLSSALARGLRRRGWSVTRRHEPADPTLGALAQRASLADPWTGGIYFTVDRHLARPALRRDLDRYDVVLSDRSFYSTLAYQGSSMSVGERRRLAALQSRATERPDRVVLLDLAPRAALGRVRGRSHHRGPLERVRFLAQVAEEYRRLARGGGWIVVDATRSSSALVREVLERLAPLLPSRSGRPSRVRRRRR